MPEIAEVRLIADNLQRFLGGKHLLQLRIRDMNVLKRWVDRCCPGLMEFNAKLDQMPNGLLVKQVRTRGKFTWLECDNDIYISIQFGMSGNIRPEPTPEFLEIYRWKGKKISKEEYLKHCHIAIEFSDHHNNTSTESNKEVIYYHDIRRFGRFEFHYSTQALERRLARLGHDPLSERSLSDTEILQKFREHNHQNICKVLMDQGLLAGVGNFIKSETLYETRISPHALIKDISDEALLKLYLAIKQIAKNAYESGGAALYTFSGIQGDRSDFKNTLKVYNHEGEKDKNGFVIVRIPDNLSPDKRSTFWVPELQTIGQIKKKIVPLKIIKLPIRKTPFTSSSDSI